MSESSRAKRHASLRSGVPGFPFDVPFGSIEAAKEYLTGDRITCLLCGHTKRKLGVHLLRIHGVSCEEYKFKYGIPITLGLAGERTTELHSLIQRKRMSALGQAQIEANLDKARAQKVGGPYRMVSTVMKQRVDRMKTITNASPVEKECVKCGAAFFASGSLALKAELTCPNHRTKRLGQKMSQDAKERIADWAKENMDRNTEYYKAKNWWGWQQNPFPLLEYAKKWSAKLRIMDKLEEAAAKIEESRMAAIIGQEE